MTEENITKKVLVEVAKDRSKEIYTDAFKPAVVEGGKALGTVMGLFNIILRPLEKACIKSRCDIDKFKNDMESKIRKIPDDKLVEPSINISGPLLESLKYTIDEKDLREMYTNLLSTAMNSDTMKLAHPSYVEIIRTMSPLDAQLIKKFKDTNYFPYAKIHLKPDENTHYPQAFPSVFAPDLIDANDPFLVSSSLVNLNRLGLLSIKDLEFIPDYDYELLKNHKFITDTHKLNAHKYNNPNLTTKLVNKGVLEITDFGKFFIKACI